MESPKEEKKENENVLSKFLALTINAPENGEMEEKRSEFASSRTTTLSARSIRDREKEDGKDEIKDRIRR